MKIKYKTDVIVLDRGQNRKDGEPRYVVIENDTNEELVVGGKATEKAMQMAAYTMKQEAVHNGAVAINKTSACVDMGNIDAYNLSSGDVISYHDNEGITELFVDPELAKVLIEKDIAEAVK